MSTRGGIVAFVMSLLRCELRLLYGKSRFYRDFEGACNVLTLAQCMQPLCLLTTAQSQSLM
jgi:hypothetical protein